MIALSPKNLEDCYTEVVRAFNIAERFMTPVFVLLDETIGHMHGKAVLPDLEEVKAGIVNRKEFTGDPKDYLPYGADSDQPAVLNPFFKGYRYHITGLHHGPTGFPTEDEKLCQDLIERLFRKIEAHEDEIESYEEYMLDDADIMIFCYGSVALSAEEAIKRLREEGIKVGMFRPITLWPSPEKKMKELAEKFDKILVPELNMGQYATEVERVMKKPFVKLNKANGRPISPAEIIAKIKESF
jgi:2-oxoglutarate ferredoxin oxidoreductase subunit alpha